MNCSLKWLLKHEALDELLIPVLDRELTALDGVELVTLPTWCL